MCVIFLCCCRRRDKTPLTWLVTCQHTLHRTHPCPRFHNTKEFLISDGITNVSDLLLFLPLMVRPPAGFFRQDFIFAPGYLSPARLWCLKSEDRLTTHERDVQYRTRRWQSNTILTQPGDFQIRTTCNSFTFFPLTVTSTSHFAFRCNTHGLARETLSFKRRTRASSSIHTLIFTSTCLFHPTTTLLKF